MTILDASGLAFARQRSLLRRSALLLAVLALLANSALFSTAHFAAVSASAQAAGHASHAHHAREDDGGDRDTAEHQTCHFCRLLAVALPPPPCVVLDELSLGGAPVVYAANALPRPAEHFSVGHPVRGPPRLIS